MISKATLHREYLRRRDGLFEKSVIWDSGAAIRCEVIIRNADGKMVRIEHKRERRKS